MFDRNNEKACLVAVKQNEQTLKYVKTECLMY